MAGKLAFAATFYFHVWNDPEDGEGVELLHSEFLFNALQYEANDVRDEVFEQVTKPTVPGWYSAWVVGYIEHGCDNTQAGPDYWSEAYIESEEMKPMGDMDRKVIEDQLKTQQRAVELRAARKQHKVHPKIDDDCLEMMLTSHSKGVNVNFQTGVMSIVGPKKVKK